MITHGKTIFSTYTYSRDRLVDDAWTSANNDFNRYIQKLRRYHDNEIQYLRTIEAHNDGFPHFHAILRFPVVLTITNGKYLDRELYRRWKNLWARGHSDYQIPRNGSHPIAYIIKYVTKGSTVKIWKKYYTTKNSGKHISTTTKSGMVPGSVELAYATTKSVRTITPLQKTCKRYKIKQVTWSRKFFKELHTK